MNVMVSDHSKHFAIDESDTRLLRDAFARFATGVTIVTAMTEDGPVAITANSFTSVSLDPPLVLWAIDRHSRRFAHFERAERYCIHVLAEGQDELCWRIARNAFGLSGAEFRLNHDGVPVLTDCLARFECSRENVVQAGDHALIIGRVARASFDEQRGPLGFFSGKIGTFSGQESISAPA